jgi:membrane protease YdiL (CAAX protease family)
VSARDLHTASANGARTCAQSSATLGRHHFMGAAKRSSSGAKLCELTTFVSLTLGGAWLASWVAYELIGFHATQYTFATRLLTASWLYALMLSWQPLLAQWIVRRLFVRSRPLDRAPPRLPAARFVLLGAGGAGMLCMASAACAWLLGGPLLWRSAHAAEPFVASVRPSWQFSVVLLLAWAATLSCLWLQAACEEVGFRGYCLTRSMELFGAWRGLWLHGALWGLWYVPMVLFGGGVALQAGKLGAIVISCVLLGGLLAWLRLASRSVVPTIVANVVITLGAGLPYTLHGLDAGVRGELFGPIGWALMLVTIALMASNRRLRQAVSVPGTA